MSRELPSQANVRFLKLEAKRLKKLHSARDVSVCQVFRQVRRLAKLSDLQILDSDIPLNKVQYALALDYGSASWNKLMATVEQCSADALKYERLLGKAREAFKRKSTASYADEQLLINELKTSGRIGADVAAALLSDGDSRMRRIAPVALALTKDPRAIPCLRTALQDPNWRVRVRSLCWYAALIHPELVHPNPWQCQIKARSVPTGAHDICALIKDPSVNARWYVVKFLTPYLGLGDENVERAVRDGLGDPVHKVSHAAALALNLKCLRCKKVRRSS
jgi:hypothetical protein